MGVLTDKVNEVNALARTNLAEHGINLDETTETDDIVSNIVKIPPLKYAYSVKSLFRNGLFPEGTELIIDIPNCYDLTETFAFSHIKKLKISGNNNGNGVILDRTFNATTAHAKFVEIDFTDFNLCVVTWINAFSQQRNLVKILGEFDFSNCATNITFINNASLEEIRLKPNTLFVDFTILQSSLLSTDTIQSIVDGLATVEEQKTLKLHSSVVEKLTDEQWQIIYDKNWSVG